MGTDDIGFHYQVYVLPPWPWGRVALLLALMLGVGVAHGQRSVGSVWRTGSISSQEYSCEETPRRCEQRSPYCKPDDPSVSNIGELHGRGCIRAPYCKEDECLYCGGRCSYKGRCFGGAVCPDPVTYALDNIPTQNCSGDEINKLDECVSKISEGSNECKTLKAAAACLPSCSCTNTLEAGLETLIDGCSDVKCGWAMRNASCLGHRENMELSGFSNQSEEDQTTLIFLIVALFVEFTVLYSMSGPDKSTTLGDMCCCSENSWQMWCYFASLGFTIGKIFPYDMRYSCDNWCCVNAVHTATMTLANFPFDMLELILVQKRSIIMGYERGGAFLKVAGIFVNFVWVIVSGSKNNALDAGSTVLVVVACLAEIVLMAFELYLFFSRGSSASVVDEVVDVAQDPIGQATLILDAHTLATS